ncbi:unnamed protein product [Rotaria sordida]|uniref:Uncharacterized protein n=1 Tax=Rotaria sordida TaxID=392033 RepID=A0A819EEM0_9BILA|nr:unnamed protein product [Rotaria sordida]CAF3848393.1 unnamed protein product [Rotaria sordida]
MSEEAELHDGVFFVRNPTDEWIDRRFVDELFELYYTDVKWHNIDESKAYCVIPKENVYAINAVCQNLVGKTFKNHEIWRCEDFYKENYRLSRPTKCGLDLKSQEAALRLQPDIVIATSGRLIEHIHNSPSFTLQNIEILVLHEVDREAIIAALRTQTFHYRVIAVAQTKRQCHRMHVMLGLLGFKIGELYSDLSQTQLNRDFFLDI